MPTSTLIHYTSSDASAPQLSGSAGSLLTVLDAILVNGYGSQPAAGWSKPFANSGNIGCYKQGAGSSGFSVLINDNGANATSTYKEAWATGWEVLTAITGPVGVGSGQFPTAAQLLTTGHAVIRKSSAADSTARFWRCYADNYTFYFFVQSELTGDYKHLFFGDLFSLAGSSDSYRCFIRAHSNENTALGSNDSWINVGGNPTVSNTPGIYAARGYGGGGGSKALGVITNGSLTNGSTVSGTSAMVGNVQSPNGYDNSFYLVPLRVTEPSPGIIRGRYRGMYQVMHAVASFGDGQVIAGTGDFSGKTFQIITTTNTVVAFETSAATVETN